MDAFCSGCGTALKPDQVLYTEDARIVCMHCSGKADIVRADKNVAGNIRTAALTSLCAGVIGWFVNPFFILNIMTVGSAVYVLTSFKRGDERFTQHIAKEKGLLIAAAVIGLVLCVVQLVLVAFVFTAVATQPPRYY